MMMGFSSRHHTFTNQLRTITMVAAVLISWRLLVSTFLMTMSEHRIVHLNHAGASPSPDSVLKAVIEHIQLEQSHGGYAAAAMADDALQAVYENTAKLISAETRNEIALVESATVAWTRLFYAFAAYQHERRPGPKVILLSEAEYAANVVAACRWAQTHDDWTVLTIPSQVDEHGKGSGKVDLNILRAMLAGTYTYEDGTLDPGSIALICITHVPTNSGIVNPVVDIGKQLTDYNTSHSDGTKVPPILYLVDACQSVGQLPIDVKAIRCHGMVATGRKYIRGPRGTGFLYIQENIANQLWPHHVDHYSVPVAAVPKQLDTAKPVEDVLAFQPRAGAKRFEFWESNIAGKLGFGAAVQHALELGKAGITDPIVNKLAPYLYEKLQKMDGIQPYYEPECGIVTFLAKGIDSAELKRLLWEPGEFGVRFEVSVVPATSTPLDSARTQIPDLFRASLHSTTTIQEIDLFCAKLSSIL